MNRWEYCDVTWQPDQVIVTYCQSKEEPIVKTFGSPLWPQVLARLGADGWELVSSMNSPAGVQEYFFYFKRPLPSN
jgi:hypothetical protein